MGSAARVALIAVTSRGCEQARLLRGRLRRGELYRSEQYGPSAHVWERLFGGPLAELVTTLFHDYEQLVFFLAAGAVVRLIAPHIVAKASDPGVLAVDEAGQFVIPLLSGHAGGANDFARTVAGCLGALPVITTASDVIGGLSLDLLEAQHGWRAEPAACLKEAALALVNREPVAVVQEIGAAGAWLDELGLPANVTYLHDAAELGAERFARIICISDRLVRDVPPTLPTLWFRPRSLVLGVGCERGVPVAALEEGLDRFLDGHGYAAASIATIATVTLKADEGAIVALARKLGCEMAFFSPEQLAAVKAPTPSAVVERCVGTPGVAEPAALLAAGAEQLLMAKQVIDVPGAAQRMTFALARDRRYRTRPRTGRVVFIGAGPGDPELLTLKARRLLQQAEVVIYAGSLIPERVLGAVAGTAGRHNSAYLTLEEVMAIMLPAARAGKQVVRLHSGDTSLYSAIQEQMQLLDEAGLEYEVVPGVSSFQAAAAALCSELTLPDITQTVILTRAEGATPMPDREGLAALAQHGSTLCIFLSARLGADVQRQLLTGYPPDTPVAIVYRVSWPDEKIIITQLERLAEELRTQGLERTTLILVGPALARHGSHSRLYDRSHGHIFRKRCRDEDDPAP